MAHIWRNGELAHGLSALQRGKGVGRCHEATAIIIGALRGVGALSFIEARAKRNATACRAKAKSKAYIDPHMESATGLINSQPKLAPGVGPKLFIPSGGPEAAPRAVSGVWREFCRITVFNLINFAFDGSFAPRYPAAADTLRL